MKITLTAEEELARRREQNRLAQERSRKRKLGRNNSSIDGSNEIDADNIDQNNEKIVAENGSRKIVESQILVDIMSDRGESDNTTIFESDVEEKVTLKPINHQIVVAEISRLLGIDHSSFSDEDIVSDIGFRFSTWQDMQRDIRAEKYKTRSLEIAAAGIGEVSSVISNDHTTQTSNANDLFTNSTNFNSTGDPSIFLTDLQWDLILSQTQFEPIQRIVNWSKIPENWYPTKLQKSIEHHPYIDVCFPWPSMRDKILSMIDFIDEEELCKDLHHHIIDDNDKNKSSSSKNQENEVNQSSISTNRNEIGIDKNSSQFAFKVWGNDPLNFFSWEVGEQFAQKWWTLLDPSIIRQTNWWRLQRNLSPITIKDEL